MKDSLGDRMKKQYESRTKVKLMRRCPTIIRLDGKAFHTYTRGLNKPFDITLMDHMYLTAQYLCENIMGVKCAYVQSDEISLLLTDYRTTTTEAWFDYNIQKMCSVSASYATAKFNQLRWLVYGDSQFPPKLAQFDSRVFQIADHEEVVNYFIWRQKDAERNSLQSLAQSLYSHKELHGKKSNDLQELCFQKGQNWNNLSSYKKRGTFVRKFYYLDQEEINPYGYTVDEIEEESKLNKENFKTLWKREEETPMFSTQRQTILRLL